MAGVLGAEEPGIGDADEITSATADLSRAGSGGAPALRTEFAFQLPRGYLDDDGVLHRSGVMRLATARDELLPLYDARVQENPAFTTVVLLSRVITELGTLSSVSASVVERMFASDVAFLQDLYRRINAEGHTHAAVVCPSCQHHFVVDISGGRLGES
ncbi:hypothetical protein EDD28_2211 [Salana multivorans]|uniref:Secreted protein n=1 Tax=Salana multivorans TaxID=120377 RepID=A0A3N2DCU1_9MICO|nr:hypothetical protein [Salana multivorans]ROR97610.1 hypothetical protein EDD28_2211 [Salana multivorans]